MGKGKVFRIMLDNFKPEQITEAVELIKEDFETEASGGINLDNIEEYAKDRSGLCKCRCIDTPGKEFGFEFESQPPKSPQGALNLSLILVLNSI